MEDFPNSSNEEDERKDSLIKTEEQKKPFITFAKLNKYFLIPFLSPISCMLANYFLLLIDSTKVVKNGEIFVPISVEISYMLAGCLYFFSRFHKKIEGGKEDLAKNEESTSS